MKCYVAGAYRAKTEYGVLQNIRSAEDVAVKWAELTGDSVFIPHKNTAFLGGALTDAYFLQCGLDFLDVCDRIVVVPGFEKSAGTLAEIKRAVELGIPVYYYPNTP
jgi:hypothetical protein